MIFTGKVWTVGKRRTHLLIVEPATRILYKCGLKCKRRVAHFKHVTNYGSKKDVFILKLLFVEYNSNVILIFYSRFSVLKY
jgi:hypothetical protein